MVDVIRGVRRRKKASASFSVSSLLKIVEENRAKSEKRMEKIGKELDRVQDEYYEAENEYMFWSGLYRRLKRHKGATIGASALRRAVMDMATANLPVAYGETEIGSYLRFKGRFPFKEIGLR